MDIPLNQAGYPYSYTHKCSHTRKKFRFTQRQKTEERLITLDLGIYPKLYMVLTPSPTANCLPDDWIITFEAMPYIMVYITDGSVSSYPNPLGLPVYNGNDREKE